MRRKWMALLMALSLAVGSAGTYAGMKWAEDHEAGFALDVAGVPKKKGSGPADSARLERVSQAYDLIVSQYVEKVEKDALVEGAIQGMLAKLDDPYSVYMDKKTAQQFNESLESSFEGIGAEVGMEDGKIVIVAPFKNSPAEKAGLKPHDRILKVDGKRVDGLDLYQTTVMIRGKKGTIVKIEVERKNVKDPFIVKVKRDQIPLETVFSDVKKVDGKQIGYIEVTSFAEETAADFKKQLKALEEKGISGLAIDVRGNPGGLLVSVEAILRELVSGEKPFVQIEKRNGKRDQYFSTLKKGKSYPIVVLVDKGSASASEILAGALQEAEGYPLIGETTFGKGTVQQAFPIDDGGNIKLTLFKWLTPDGNWIHRKGIKPDVKVEQPIIFSAHPITSEEALKVDMNNEQVKNAQVILEGLGYHPGRTDGYFSSGTVRSVKAFQQQARLQPTGKIDAKTASALEAAALKERKNEKNDLQLRTALRLLAK
ncbi:PDZ domain-containing protein [Neobacillus notoginsengisoli]|uniref:C-terminal processing peptidase n=1 Tax=Neobacillus notoginsengisoli TaxID=1578198 RepID=A0A417YRR1_9BACI|nr:S41 family peptidase [Neobacillus notoginsengisoli]RHW37358.1 PDZ domain-containing protein [Neobacillus notoginsengisoli]